MSSFCNLFRIFPLKQMSSICNLFRIFPLKQLRLEFIPKYNLIKNINIYDSPYKENIFRNNAASLKSLTPGVL